MRHNKVGVQNLFKLLGRFSIFIILVFSVLNAKTFENFKRSTADAYSKYQDNNDIEFAKYLKQQFKAYEVLTNKVIYKEPKSSFLPLATINKYRAAGPITHITVPPYIERKILIDEDIDKKKDINFDFFGTNLKFDIPLRLKSAKYYPQNQKGINNFFDTAASSRYFNLISDINKISKKMKLNDWAVYLLVNKIANRTFTNSDDSKLLSWFIFSKMGYSVKIGLMSKHITLLYESKYIIYEKARYKFENKIFYMFDDTKRFPRIYSYKYDYTNSTKAFDLSLKILPNLSNKIKYKLLKFKSLGHDYEIRVSYNDNLLEFMSTYPQANLETFFNTPMSERTYTDIATGLKKLIDLKQASLAINFVLNFVQSAFVYEIDKKNFGREKVMFAQEVLIYNKSDCDDRAVLFSYLIKKLFGFSVVGVKYKDYISTALYIPMQGDFVNVKSKKYILSDPSYKDASIGQSLAKYKSIKPESYIFTKEN